VHDRLPRLFLEIRLGERLPATVAHDKAASWLLDRPAAESGVQARRPDSRRQMSGGAPMGDDDDDSI
jgi:hypothetical protein